jgi:hypothetical protein
MIGMRYTVATILLCLAPLLASCSGTSGYVSDHWPRWAGGMPDDVPPRPGAPGYEEFIAHGGANQGATPSSATGTPAPEFVATGSSAAAAKGAPGAKPSASVAKGVTQQPSAAPMAPAAPTAQAAPVEPAEDQPSQESGVVRGGLY